MSSTTSIEERATVQSKIQIKAELRMKGEMRLRYASDMVILRLESWEKGET